MLNWLAPWSSQPAQTQPQGSSTLGCWPSTTRRLLRSRSHMQPSRFEAGGTSYLCTSVLPKLCAAPVDCAEREAEAVQHGDGAPEVEACASR